MSGLLALATFVGTDSRLGFEPLIKANHAVLQSNGKAEAWRSGLEHMLDSPRSQHPSPNYPPSKVSPPPPSLCRTQNGAGLKCCLVV